MLRFACLTALLTFYALLVPAPAAAFSPAYQIGFFALPRYSLPQDAGMVAATESGGRHYLLRVPRGKAPRSGWPLVIALHAFGQSTAAFETVSGLSSLGEKQGFIAAYPEARDGVWHFAQKDSAADVAFLRAMIAGIAAMHPVDTTRIYATGLSNGAQMVWRLGCVAPELLAAIAPVSGSYANDKDCRHRLTLPAVIVHGTADDVMPYIGRFPQFGPRAFARDRAAQNRCDMKPHAIPVKPLIAEIWGDCRYGADVMLYTVPGGKHAWPRAAEPMIWDFFKKHARD